jgi:hypothetical protein
VVDINDAIKVLTDGPLQLFVGTRPALALVAARRNVARSRLGEAQVDLDRARSLIVATP